MNKYRTLTVSGVPGDTFEARDVELAVAAAEALGFEVLDTTESTEPGLTWLVVAE